MASHDLHVVKYLLDLLGLNYEDVLPIYIGDDTTDENAFKVLDSSKYIMYGLVDCTPELTHLKCQFCFGFSSLQGFDRSMGERSNDLV